MDKVNEETLIECGTSDIFHELGLQDADELLAKSKLVRAISQAIKERRRSQSDLAKLTGNDQPKISQLMHGRVTAFSSDRLMHILTKLDQDIYISIRQKPANESRDARISVERAHGI